MGKTRSDLDSELAAWIQVQPVFFVASAPDGPGGHVNLSPRGGDCLRVLAPDRLAFVDRTGSGVETIAHLRQNGRLTLMWCAFDGPPRIVRVFGRGRAVEPPDADFAALRAQLPPMAGVRALLEVAIAEVRTSCGFGVPRLQFQGPRPDLDDWSARKGEAGVRDYQQQKNGRSLDGLPGLRWVTPE